MAIALEHAEIGDGEQGEIRATPNRRRFRGLLCAAGPTEEVVELRTPPELCVELHIALAHDATPFHEAILPGHAPHAESTGYSGRNLEPERQ
jgi:hypothetical protein